MREGNQEGCPLATVCLRLFALRSGSPGKDLNFSLRAIRLYLQCLDELWTSCLPGHSSPTACLAAGSFSCGRRFACRLFQSPPRGRRLAVQLRLFSSAPVSSFHVIRSGPCRADQQGRSGPDARTRGQTSPPRPGRALLRLAPHIPLFAPGRSTIPHLTQRTGGQTFTPKAGTGLATACPASSAFRSSPRAEASFHT